VDSCNFCQVVLWPFTTTTTAAAAVSLSVQESGLYSGRNVNW